MGSALPDRAGPASRRNENQKLLFDCKRAFLARFPMPRNGAIERVFTRVRNVQRDGFSFIGLHFNVHIEFINGERMWLRVCVADLKLNISARGDRDRAGADLGR
jgi:hypothetical protein